jgi:hypothetical protein
MVPRTFLRLCAGRVGQFVNFSALAADAGVTHNTARSWLSVLEAGYVAWRLPPFHANVSKRLVKTPKLHFLDSDLVIEDGRSLLAVETKSGQTVAGDFFSGLESFRSLMAAARPPRTSRAWVVYGGVEAQKRSVAEVVPWSNLDRCRWWEDDSSTQG